jgi:hypothetical protein
LDIPRTLPEWITPKVPRPEVRSLRIDDYWREFQAEIFSARDHPGEVRSGYGCFLVGAMSMLEMLAEAEHRGLRGDAFARVVDAFLGDLERYIDRTGGDRGP